MKNNFDNFDEIEFIFEDDVTGEVKIVKQEKANEEVKRDDTPADFKYDLSIAMIVKNEEKTLEACLQGLQRLRDEINCELIITDTGSTDRTIEIAEKYADTVLHFEWCNDFSKARNTGVEAARGKWFMFIDADEVFDRTIIEIARFIKMADRDKYDNATYIVRNVMDDAGKRYNDFRAGRMFNFTKKKRYFTFTIHEAIPSEGERYQIDAVALHTGYHKDIFDGKRVRNREILEKELAEDPNNIRFMKQIIDISTDDDEKLELAEKAIALCKSKEAKNPDMVFSIFTFLARMHLSKKNNEEVLVVCDDFLRIRMKDRLNLPTLEMSWISATASFNMGNKVEALKKFEFYKACYEHILKNPDNVFCSMGVYTSNKEPVYHQSCLQIVECLQKIGEVNKANQFLESLNCYKYKEQNEYIILNLYANRVIALKNKALFENLLGFIHRNKIDIYSKEKFPTMIIGRMQFNNDITDFVQRCDKVVFSKICLLAFKSSDFATDLVYNHLINKTTFKGAKENDFYFDIMRLYVLYMFDFIKNKEQEEQKLTTEVQLSNSLSNSGLFADKNNKTKPFDRQDAADKVNTIFELMVNHNYNLIKKSNNISEFRAKGMNNITKMQAMTIIVYDGLKDKNKNQAGYVEALKKAIPYAERHTDSIRLALRLATNQGRL